VTAGGRTKVGTVATALLVFAVVMHLIAYGMVSRYAGLSIHPDKTALVAIASALLSLSLMLSQAMESVTRAFYTRSDLDLLLSSPAQAPKIFAVRIATIALSVMAIAALLAGPFINVLAAFLLWRSFESGRASVVLLVPVMAAGQLTGGSPGSPFPGEDAPDLIWLAVFRRSIAAVGRTRHLAPTIRG
jgi:hypothetical protein